MGAGFFCCSIRPLRNFDKNFCNNSVKNGNFKGEFNFDTMKRLFVLVVILFTIPFAATAAGNILIKGGTVYDGTGDRPVKTDILIKEGKILCVGDSESFRGKTAKEAKKAEVIDATGLVVAPGFIDPHSHVNTGLAKEKTREGKGYLRMGVTTVLCGVCGSSPIPLSSQADKLTSNGTGLNVGYFVGLGSVRKKIIGSENRKPAPEELEQMKELVREGMEWGAFGVSSGLIYTPGIYAKTDELIALTSVASQYGGIYTTHMRSEASIILKALNEALEIGRTTGADVNISHIKCAGQKAHGLSKDVIARICEAQREGMHVTADQYPYDASSTSLSATLLPSWARVGKAGRNRMYDDPDTLEIIKSALRKKLDNSGNGANLVISPSTKDKEIKGKSIAQIASEWGMSPEDAVIAIFRKSSPSVINHSMDEADVRNFMVQPWVMTGTDGSASAGHPRSRGTYAKKIRKYVNGEHLISLDEMIRRSTGLVADTYGISGRGYIREGYWADIIVFDPASVRDNATFEKPSRYATGFRCVLVNGIQAVIDDEATGELAGVVIRRDNSAKVR